VCRRCGAPIQREVVCAHCQEGSFYVSAIRAAGTYGHPLSTTIQQFKYNGQRGLHQPLGRMMAAYWQARDVHADLVIPVPLHPQRLRERGYNQSRLLAIEFCRDVSLPLLAGEVLRRERATRQQVLLGMAERRQNVAGAFRWHGPPLGGVKVLLIDDVATTGSTLEACGEVLQGAGAGKVWALTVARAAHTPLAARWKPRASEG
jgi:ComF family protein